MEKSVGRVDVMYATSKADGSAAVVLMDGGRCSPVVALPWWWTKWMGCGGKKRLKQ